MFGKEEIFTILAVSLVLAFSISLLESWNTFLYILLAVFIVIMVNVVAKKIAGYYLESDVEISLWHVNRSGFKPTQKFKKPLAAGIILPLVSRLIFYPIGVFVWMASLVFDVKPRGYGGAKIYGTYSFSEINEAHIGWIAAAGISVNILFAVIGYLVGFSDFAKISLYYAFFNMLPISDLDGNKLFFGSLVTWVFLAAIVLIGLAGVMLIN